MRRLGVYVASSSAEDEAHRLRVRTCMSLVDAYETTSLAHDWLTHVETHPGVPNFKLLRDDAKREAGGCWHAVSHADLLWVLASRWPSEGAATELGLALAGGLRIVVSGETHHTGRNVFATHADRVFDSDVGAWRWITEQARAVTP